MSTWPKVQLGDHADFLTGFPFKSAFFRNSSLGSVRLLRGDNVGQGLLRWDGAKHWFEDERANYLGFELSEGDVILAMDRPWIEAGLKYASVRKSDLPCLLVQRVARLRGANGLTTEYLRYVIGSAAFTDHVKGIITGVNVPHISGKDIKRFSFRLPPPPVQRRIASILGAYDDLIEVNRRRIAVLEEMARRLFDEWFVHFRFPGHEGHEMVDSERGPVPKGWRNVDADSVIAFDPPTRVPREGEKPFIPMAQLATTSSFIGVPEQREGNSGSKFRNNDTLLARITPCLENGKTGLVRRLSSPAGIGFGSTEFIVMREKLVGPAFTYCLARSPHFRGHAIKSMSGATGRQRVRVESLKQFQLAMPTSTLLSKFENAAWTWFETAGVLAEANQRLSASRDLLLPRLISGELSVEIAERELEDAA